METVLRKEKADLSLWMSTSVVSNKYNPGRTNVKLITCCSEICTLKALDAEVSMVTRYCSVTRANDNMLARQVGLYHTSKPPNLPLLWVSIDPAEVWSLKDSPSRVLQMSVKRSLLQKIWSVDSPVSYTHLTLPTIYSV